MLSFDSVLSAVRAEGDGGGGGGTIRLGGGGGGGGGEAPDCGEGEEMAGAMPFFEAFGGGLSPLTAVAPVVADGAPG